MLWIEPWVSVIITWSLDCTSNPHARVWAEDLSVWRIGLHCRSSHALLSSLLPPSPRQIDPLEMDADMQSLGSTTWLLDQRDSNRRPVSTKYETTIFWGRIPTAAPQQPLILISSPPAASSPLISLSHRQTHTHTHRVLYTCEPVPSHCDGIASLRAACSCTLLCPAQRPTPTSYLPWQTLLRLSHASPTPLAASLACCCCSQWWNPGTDDPGLISFYSGPALSTKLPLLPHPPLPANLHLPANPW